MPVEALVINMQKLVAKAIKQGSNQGSLPVVDLANNMPRLAAEVIKTINYKDGEENLRRVIFGHAFRSFLL